MRDKEVLDKEIAEGNILIAEFMGGIYYDSWKCPNYMMPHPVFAFVKEEIYIDARNLSYNSSWGALMPVVEKIESLGYKVNIEKCQCYIATEFRLITKQQSFDKDGDEGKREAVFLAIIEFIKSTTKINS